MSCLLNTCRNISIDRRMWCCIILTQPTWMFLYIYLPIIMLAFLIWIYIIFVYIHPLYSSKLPRVRALIDSS